MFFLRESLEKQTLPTQKDTGPGGRIIIELSIAIPIYVMDNIKTNPPCWGWFLLLTLCKANKQTQLERRARDLEENLI